MNNRPDRTVTYPVHRATGSLIRSYEAGDRERLVRFWLTVFPDEPPHNAPQAVIDLKLKVDDGLLLVAILEGDIVGSTLAGYDGHRGWLYGVGVLPSLQGSGLGRALVEQAILALRERGCIKVNLQVRAGNEAVLSFYERLGFSVEDRVSMGRRID